MRFLRKELKYYLERTTKLFEGKNALLVNTVSGGVLFLIGDAIEQGLEIGRGVHSDFDWKRFTRIGVVGILEGPPHYYFYKYLDVVLPNRDKFSITKKILADQFIACPMFNVIFFNGMAYLEGKKAESCWGEFKHKFPTVYLVDWLLWPPFQLFNFYFVPPGFRVLYVNAVTVFWNVFLSYMKHYDQFEPIKEKADNDLGHKTISKQEEDTSDKNSLYTYFHIRGWWPYN